jgi:hypothetical protein
MSSVELFQPGAIKRQARKMDNLTRAVMLASVDLTQQWVNTEIVTLRQRAMDLAIDQTCTISSDLEYVQQMSVELANTRYKMQREFVTITSTEITIGINCDVIDDSVTQSAISRLLDIADLSLECTYYFGDSVDVSVDSVNRI